MFLEIVKRLLKQKESIRLEFKEAKSELPSNLFETKNANIPHGEGRIDPDNFAPFPKNPIIAKFLCNWGG